MTELLLVRHGETDWNREGRFQGHADRPLNDVGREQARAVADELAGEGIAAVYASDLARARETAEVIAERVGAEVRVLRELREIDVGDFQGLNAAELEATRPDALRTWRAGGIGWNGGETYEALADRVVAALHRIAEEHPDDRVVVVGHGGTMRAVRAHALGVEIAEHRRTAGAIRNCEVVRLRAEGGVIAGID